MPKILCTLPNASAEISGVKFTPHNEAMLSEDVSQEVAESFASIDGYKVVQDELPVDKKLAEAVKPAPAKPSTRSKKAAPEQAAAAPTSDAAGATDEQDAASGASDADDSASAGAVADGGTAAVDGDPIF
jgi:hypothetical protein